MPSLLKTFFLWTGKRFTLFGVHKWGLSALEGRLLPVYKQYIIFTEVYHVLTCCLAVGFYVPSQAYHTGLNHRSSRPGHCKVVNWLIIFYVHYFVPHSDLLWAERRILVCDGGNECWVKSLMYMYKHRYTLGAQQHRNLKQRVPLYTPLSPSGYLLLLSAPCCCCGADILHIKLLCWLFLSSRPSLPSKLPSTLQSHRKKVSSFLAHPVQKGFGCNHIYQCCISCRNIKFW